jgi:predicted lipoprotein with Yx(FWY)xxD motif
MASRRTAKFRIGGVAALATAALIIAGCGSASSSSSSTTTAAAAPAAATSSSSTTSTTAAAATGITVKTAKGSAGTYLAGPNGHALYLWVADTGGKSACSGACANAWPPLLTKGSPSAGSGVDASDLGTIMRSGGAEQVTYKGHPLYYFVADKSAGSTDGQGSDGFGAKWWLVAPSGTAITAGATTSASSGGSSSGGSSSSSSSGGWG